MAHGLRVIANKSYNAYGTGRDWFFLGDAEYRDGRRTPQPNQGGMRPQPPPCRPRTLIPEVGFEKRQRGSKKKTVERWQKMHEQVPANFNPAFMQAAATAPANPEAKSQTALRRQGLSASSLPSSGTYVTTYNELGRDPRFTGERYELKLAVENKMAGVRRNSSEPALKEMEGDFTLGIRGPRPFHHSSYMEHGHWDESLPRKHQVHLAETNRDAGLPPKNVPPKDMEGDFTSGIKGQQPHYMGTYWELGQEEKTPAWMGGRKHQHSVAEELRDAGVPPRQVPPKDMEGDHTRGIKGELPEHHTTYGDLGRFQKVNYPRYDFAPVATTQYRLSRWRAMRET